MVNPLLVGLLVILIGGGGAVVTHTAINPDSPITESINELVCNLKGSFEQFNDPECPQYQTNNEPPPETNSTEFDLFNPDTWTPLTLFIIFSIGAFLILRQRQDNGIIVVQSR
ncbi:hypothetical protein EB155_09705 [archaeon]|nr:hypothetical protein [archaeon]NDB80125.1 hypothetical protein [archaeon]